VGSFSGWFLKIPTNREVKPLLEELDIDIADIWHKSVAPFTAT
jgi:hypothetical protein